MPKRIFLRTGLNSTSLPNGILITSTGSNLAVQNSTELVTTTIVDAPIGNADVQFTYKIGQWVSDEGGIIFHRWVEDSKQWYLVVDTGYLGGSASFSSVTSSLIGTTSQSLWNGPSNSVAMLNQGDVSGAAYLCDTSTNGGKNDWYLPAIFEMNKIWINYFHVSQGVVAAGASAFDPNTGHWSSTEQTATQAYSHSFFSGFFNSLVSKSNKQLVRAVRKFSI
jgi:hypothetical protein